MPSSGRAFKIGEITQDGARCAAPNSLASLPPKLLPPQPIADSGQWSRPAPGPTYAALDLGTNNCRLLIARPAHRDVASCGFRIVDSFSRIVRLGEGLTQTGRLGEAAIERTLDALAVCHDKMRGRHVTRARLIATEACRAATNAGEFVDMVHSTFGLDLEIVDRETEAHLAATGCASLADAAAKSVLLFDIGGGSSEVIWLEQGSHNDGEGAEGLRERIRFWVSLKLGVVSLAEKFGGIDVSEAVFEAMVACVTEELRDFIARVSGHPRCERFHLLGTSGTVTTVAGVFLNLSRYDRRRVDGLWMSDAEVSGTVERLRKMSYRERMSNGCIGPERADLVLAGCAILEALRRAFPAERLRIADRGLREGILLQLMNADRGKGRVDL
ncbi:Ppx/GppA phosphatase family protein [Methylovirgula sp. HY1]|uniref:Ppx/GppA phosphatase family protein n=1 Tax=Methylovirgula sp. HY1 TaxID=2822761 RepID=UPI001C5BC515|nr:Ppx/GppA phosphatase family protein [Methylovirgula sp. HY1]QXX73823.1 Exopolyphosphatase [Methylovirgula sp. HY1]